MTTGPTGHPGTSILGSDCVGPVCVSGSRFLELPLRTPFAISSTEGGI